MADKEAYHRSVVLPRNPEVLCPFWDFTQEEDLHYTARGKPQVLKGPIWEVFTKETTAGGAAESFEAVSPVAVGQVYKERFSARPEWDPAWAEEVHAPGKYLGETMVSELVSRRLEEAGYDKVKELNLSGSVFGGSLHSPKTAPPAPATQGQRSASPEEATDNPAPAAPAKPIGEPTARVSAVTRLTPRRMMSAAGPGRGKHKRGTPTLEAGPENSSPSLRHMVRGGAAQTPPSKRSKRSKLEAVGAALGELVEEYTAGLEDRVAELEGTVERLENQLGEVEQFRRQLEGYTLVKKWGVRVESAPLEVSPKPVQKKEPAPDLDSTDEEDYYGKVSPAATS
ncbi:hypothetical protein WJX72_006725 [[Myrmecia] bisecta]|uniref:Uncharacterized protein n=1 Tax=[Myrmecia] bisecta TaxID=41462 RepID=A0AAW1Q6F3_9CHLO